MNQDNGILSSAVSNCITPGQGVLAVLIRQNEIPSAEQLRKVVRCCTPIDNACGRISNDYKKQVFFAMLYSRMDRMRTVYNAQKGTKITSEGRMNAELPAVWESETGMLFHSVFGVLCTGGFSLSHYQSERGGNYLLIETTRMPGAEDFLLKNRNVLTDNLLDWESCKRLLIVQAMMEINRQIVFRQISRYLGWNKSVNGENSLQVSYTGLQVSDDIVQMNHAIQTNIVPFLVRTNNNTFAVCKNLKSQPAGSVLRWNSNEEETVKVTHIHNRLFLKSEVMQIQ